MAPISRQVALVSYPRSGNSLLRSLLESCTGILTGSDGHADAPLSRDLAAFGLAAEGISDGRVWLVKSHWPERRGAAEVRVPRRMRVLTTARPRRVCRDDARMRVLTTARASPPPFGMHLLTTARASPPRFCMHLLTMARGLRHASACICSPWRAISATLLHASAHHGPRPPSPLAPPRCACMRRCSSCVARWMRSTRIGTWS